MRLGLKTLKTSGVYVIPNEEEPKLQALYKRYGIEEAGFVFEPICAD